jgi:hypothetical protein
VYTTELDKEVIIRIYIKELEFIKIANIKHYVIHKLYSDIENLLIRGIDNILNTSVQPIKVRRKEDDGSYISNDEFMIRTNGLDIVSLSYRAKDLDIDLTHIHIGSVMDTFEYYGIEAARSRIIEQMISVMEGNSPTYHHLSIYADILSWSGKVKAIERAVRSERNKTLAMASGFSAGKVLMNAAGVGIRESTNGITAPVMLGSIPKIGTNFNNILINEDFVKANTKNPRDIINDL